MERQTKHCKESIERTEWDQEWRTESLRITIIHPMASFLWQRKNVEHIGKHGIAPEEAAFVVAHARPPYPEYLGESKFRVRGQTEAGRYIQVIYLFAVDASGIEWDQVDLSRTDLDDPDLFYVIHAMELSDHEKRRYRRRMK